MTQKVDVATIELWVADAKKGHSEAFGKVFEALSDQIYRYVLIRIGDDATAKDIVSETFRRAWSSITRYKSQNFRAYLYKIAYNLMCDHFQERKRFQVDADIRHIEDSHHSTLENLIISDDTRNLCRALNKLPEQYAEIIKLRYVEELSIQETCDILHLSSEAVRTKQHRAVKKLKQLYKKLVTA